MQDPGISSQVPLAAQAVPVSRRLAYVLVLLAGCLWGTIGTAYHLDWLTAVLSDEDRVRWHLDSLRREDPTSFDLASIDRQRHELERQQAKFVAVIERMEDPEAAGPIAAKLDALGKQLAANARDREALLARQAAWQRDQARIGDVLAFCRRVSADMARVTAWADCRAMAQTLRVRFELFPADHEPRWIATSEVVPDAARSTNLYSGSGCIGGT